MHNQDFSVTLLVNKTPGEVFKAINDVNGWWTGDPGVEGNTKNIGDEFTYRFGDIHYSKQKITELVPGKKVVWLITDSQLNFIKDKDEWTGTKIHFEISEKNKGTEIRFTHEGLAKDKECYTDCSNAWSSYINNSLKKFITGTKAEAS
jgi:hypothetical protein